MVRNSKLSYQGQVQSKGAYLHLSTFQGFGKWKNIIRTTKEKKRRRKPSFPVLPKHDFLYRKSTHTKKKKSRIKKKKNIARLHDAKSI